MDARHGPPHRGKGFESTALKYGAGGGCYESHEWLREEINQALPLHALITKQKLSCFGYITLVEICRLEKLIMIWMIESCGKEEDHI